MLKMPTFPTCVSLPRCTLDSSATSVQTQEIGCSDLLTACFASQVQCSCFTPELVVILYEQKIPQVIDKSNKRTLRRPHTSFAPLRKPARTRHGYSPLSGLPAKLIVPYVTFDLNGHIYYAPYVA